MPSIKSKSKDINNKIKKKDSSNMSNIDNIRNKIDAIDNRIHDLIMKRTLYVKDISLEKAKSSNKKIVIYRPLREYEVLVKLIKKHKGDFPIDVLIKIWRTMIGAYISMQGNLNISYFSSYRELVNNHFGMTVNYSKIKNVKKSLDLLSLNKIDLLVLPVPNSRRDWWALLLNYKSLSIIGELSDSFFHKSKAVILGWQNVEYSSKNKVIYIVTVEKDDVNLFKNYLIVSNYLIWGKRKIKNDKYVFIISIILSSRKEALEKLSALKNKDFIEDKNVRIVGVLPNIEKKLLNG